MIVYIASFVEIAIFIGFWIYYIKDPLYDCPCRRYQQSFPIAKSSALLININICVLLLMSNRIWKRWLYYNSKNIHLFLFVWICLFAGIHTTAHIVNFIKLSSIYTFFNYPVGITGFLLVLTLIVFPFVNRVSYSKRLFNILHGMLLIIFLVTVCIHGTYCTIKYTQRICPKATSWIWILPGVCLYLIQYIIKYTKIQKVNSFEFFTDNIISIDLGLAKNYIGKTIWINIPSISIVQWHPFTVCKTKSSGLLIKRRGDWTNRLFEYFKSENQNKYVLLDGPYKNLPDNFYLKAGSEPCIFICSGIGITTFLHDINSVDVYLIAIVKTIDEIVWIIPYIGKTSCKIIVYLTKNSEHQFDLESTNNIVYINGRPDFENIFDNLLIKNTFIEQKRVNVYVSGNGQIYRKIKDVSKNYDVYNVLYV
jgi:hypothetical protein